MRIIGVQLQVRESRGILKLLRKDKPHANSLLYVGLVWGNTGAARCITSPIMSLIGLHPLLHV